MRVHRQSNAQILYHKLSSEVQNLNPPGTTMPLANHWPRSRVSIRDSRQAVSSGINGPQAKWHYCQVCLWCPNSATGLTSMLLVTTMSVSRSAVKMLVMSQYRTASNRASSSEWYVNSIQKIVSTH